MRFALIVPALLISARAMAAEPIEIRPLEVRGVEVSDLERFSSLFEARLAKAGFVKAASPARVLSSTWVPVGDRCLFALTLRDRATESTVLTTAVEGTCDDDGLDRAISAGVQKIAAHFDILLSPVDLVEPDSRAELIEEPPSEPVIGTGYWVLMGVGSAAMTAAIVGAVFLAIPRDDTPQGTVGLAVLDRK